MIFIFFSPHFSPNIFTTFIYIDPRLTYYFLFHLYVRGFPGNSAGKESACNAGDLSSIPGLERAPGGENGSLLQYSCLENSMNRGAWQDPWGRKEKDTTEQLILSLS